MRASRRARRPRGPDKSRAAIDRVDLTRLTLVQALTDLERGTYTSVQITEAFLARIAVYEPTYNAFVAMNADALAQAAASDAKRAAGMPLGALEGVPIVIKEALDYKGYPSTFGWAPTSAAAGGVDLMPLENAPVVQTLINAGAIILGKTNIPAFSNDNTRANSSWAGPTLNAVNIHLAPGASSSGTATSVAGGFAVWGMAEETGGSIQSPAAAQSLVGIKVCCVSASLPAVDACAAPRGRSSPACQNIHVDRPYGC